MKIHLAILMVCLVPFGVMAQRGGGGHGGGGFGGGGGMRGGGFGGGGMRGGFGGGGFRGGFGGYNGFGRGFGYGGFGYGYGGYGWGLGLGWGYPGWGYGYWPDYWDYGWPDTYDSSYGYPYANAYPNVSEYNPSPNVTVVYGPPQPAYRVYSPPSQAATGGYDQYGQPLRAPSPPVNSGWTNSNGAVGSPIYLIAFKDHIIRAASSYSVSGNTLHYVTLEHEAKDVPLDSVDRAFSAQLNRERHVPFQLPAQ